MTLLFQVLLHNFECIGVKSNIFHLKLQFQHYRLEIHLIFCKISTSSQRRCSIKKGWGLQLYFKKKTMAQVNSCEFWETLKNTFFQITSGRLLQNKMCSSEPVTLEIIFCVTQHYYFGISDNCYYLKVTKS